MTQRQPPPRTGPNLQGTEEPRQTRCVQRRLRRVVAAYLLGRGRLELRPALYAAKRDPRWHRRASPEKVKRPQERVFAVDDRELAEPIGPALAARNGFSVVVWRFVWLGSGLAAHSRQGSAPKCMSRAGGRQIEIDAIGPGLQSIIVAFIRTALSRTPSCRVMIQVPQTDYDNLSPPRTRGRVSSASVDGPRWSAALLPWPEGCSSGSGEDDAPAGDRHAHDLVPVVLLKLRVRMHDPSPRSPPLRHRDAAPRGVDAFTLPRPPMSRRPGIGRR